MKEFLELMKSGTLVQFLLVVVFALVVFLAKKIWPFILSQLQESNDRYAMVTTAFLKANEGHLLAYKEIAQSIRDLREELRIERRKSLARIKPK